MSRKRAIFDPKEQAALLGVCEGDREYIPIWLMMRCGMHPSDVSKASKKLKVKGRYIEWERAKNAEDRHEIVPDDIMDRLKKWLKKGRKLTREGYWHLVGRVGARVGHPEYSPLTLRHTFGTEMLKFYMQKEKPPPDVFDLVARKMGCTEAVVKNNYVDLQDWERASDPERLHEDNEDE